MILQIMIYPCQRADDRRLMACLRHGVTVARRQPDVSAAYLIKDTHYQAWLVLVLWRDHNGWQRGGKPFQHVFLKYLKRKTMAEALCTFWVPIWPQCLNDGRLCVGSSVAEEAVSALAPPT